ncbi:MAG: aminoacyl-tRNA hydrolase [Bacteroidetes bacterium]|nr:aminoacyl-tRNA hydrolase [Bacteroidota bacterium]
MSNKFLILGLGNPGEEYDNTRHNIGFKILDSFAHSLKVQFENSRLAFIAEGKIKNKLFFLIKPTTFMNLSGKAVNYYLQKEKIPLQNLLVITDDVALPLGAIRIRAKGSDGGHNGLKSINEILVSGPDSYRDYARLRFGIGNEYPKGAQVNYVLGKWTNDELKIISPRIELASEAIKDFGLMGIEKTMNAYNSK